MINTNILKGLLTVLCAGGFAVLAYFVTQGAVPAFDTAVQSAVFSLRNDWLTALLKPLTLSGNWQPVTVLCAVLLAAPQTRKHYGLPLSAAALSSVLFYETLKFVFQRSRPDPAFYLINESGFSFPSGHALTSLVLWGTLIMLIRAYARVPRLSSEDEYDFPRLTKPSAVNLLTGLLCVYIILMAFSRIYVGVHYPTDVLGSWCLGGCMLIAIHSSLVPALTHRGKDA
ncbi:phosphatase PAP2 family protein [Bacilliculturomica massiliensis]|uniref:phosphatase PAP2 family protein n=1 Tax=Bacilliculturomica massiliensis TaxID=1917867 RepID=UPI001030FEB7|nr:phosphatase PAP2 family protein [Bacilliculturomica massiliensis]